MRKIIGQGSEKVVYPDPQDPERKVRAEIKFDYNENQVKGAYYLGKIAHLLFPKNIPDIYFSTPKERRLEQKEHDEIHDYIQSIYLGKRKLNGEEANRLLRTIDERAADSRIQTFLNAATERGLTLDAGMQNFSFDSNGEVQFFDNDVPWVFENDEIKCFYDTEKLGRAIKTLPEPERERALKYFERLNLLFENYKNSINNKDHVHS